MLSFSVGMKRTLGRPLLGIFCCGMYNGWAYTSRSTGRKAMRPNRAALTFCGVRSVASRCVPVRALSYCAVAITGRAGLVGGVGGCAAAIPARQHTSSGTRAGTETRSFMCFQTPADGHLFPTVGAGTWRLPWLVRGGGLLLRLRFLFPFAFGFRFRHGVGGADGHLSVWLLFGEVDVLGAAAKSDEAGGGAAEEGEGLEELEEPGQGEGFGAAEGAAAYVGFDGR